MNALDGQTSEDPVKLDVVDASGRGLSLSFVWHVDRYAHTIALVDDGRLVPLLASLEGSRDDAWPESPPLQSLTAQEQPGGRRTILLVGMAGRNHWSLGAQTEGGKASSGAPAIVIDVACRLNSPDGQLASCYRSMTPAVVERAGQIAHWDASGRRCQIEILAAGDVPAAVQATHDGLSIVAPATAEPTPTTVRWKYRVVLVDPSDKGP